MLVLQFPVLRLMLLTLAALSQLYLFYCLWQAVRRLHGSAGFTAGATGLAAAAMAALFLLTLFIGSRPILWVDPPPLARVGLLYPAAIWTFGSLLAGPALLLVRGAAGLLRLFRRGWARLVSPSGPEPVDPERRRLLQAGAWSVAAAPMVMAGYGAAWESKRPELRELHLPFGCPVRVVQLTDIHAGLYMTRADIRRIAETASRLQPELLVLTGDFISNSMAYLPGCVEELAHIRAPLGTFATLGNHEHRFGDPEETRRELERHGIPMLTNAHRRIETARGTFVVAGIDDLQTGDPDLEAALRGLDPALPVLLLSHRPEIFPEAAARRIPVTLSGHWHGGQVVLQILGKRYSLVHSRTPYVEGLFRDGASRLYVSRGLGTTATPVRWNAPPEITLLHLI